MAVVKPPITGDEELDSFNDQIANELNTGLLAAGASVDSTTRIVGAGVVAVPVDTTVTAGFNHATISLYQRTSLNNVNGLTAPDRVSTTLRYNYQTITLRSQNGEGNFLVGPPWNGWYDYIPERDPVAKDDYVWRQVISVADRALTETIAPPSWSQVGLFTRPGLGSLRVVTEYEQIRTIDEDIDASTFTVRARNIFLGEVDIMPQIEGSRICWLLAEDDGSFRVDSKFRVDDDGHFIVDNPDAVPFEIYDVDKGEMVTITPTYIPDENGIAFDPDFAPPGGYTDRNFNGSSPRHEGYTTTFSSSEIFQINDGANFTLLSRDIEPRVDISIVINI